MINLPVLRVSAMDFVINRLHTSIGIFRLQGHLLTLDDHFELAIESAEFMGTDGWQLLDINTPHSQSLLKRIRNDIINHLTQISR